jgi:hypothetical protein
MATLDLRTRHIYTHDPSELEREVNAAIDRIIEDGGVVGDIKYAIDPSTNPHVRGGFGALIIYEVGRDRTAS